jgi:hypothetical protein
LPLLPMPTLKMRIEFFSFTHSLLFSVETTI